jgi:RNA polymerase sigma-70 factor, ECF subfamily
MSTIKAEGITLQSPASSTPANLSATSEQFFANAYQRGFNQTARFLLSRGIPRDVVFDTAQSAWTKAWERREQLRNPTFLLTWVNSIALNVYRTALRREPLTEALPELQASGHDSEGAMIDAERILRECKPSDRIVLESHYIRGYKLEEIAAQNNWSETAVRIRLLRARRKMKSMFTCPKKARPLSYVC